MYIHVALEDTRFHYTTGCDLHVVLAELQAGVPGCFILLIASPCRAEKNDLPVCISESVAFGVVLLCTEVCAVRSCPWFSWKAR